MIPGQTKVCKTCKEIKPFSDFHKHKECKDGLKTSCKICRNLENKIKYPKSKEKSKEQSKRYNDKHPEKRKAIWANYYERNRERLITKAKDYRNTPEGKVKRLVWNEKHKEQLKITKRAWRKNMPIKSKLKKSLRDRFYKIVKRLKKGQKYESPVLLIGCSVDQLKIHLENQFTNGMCWNNYGFGTNKWTIDHIVPLDSFNLFDYDEQKKAFNYKNLQPMWGIDNFKKGNKVA